MSLLDLGRRWRPPRWARPRLDASDRPVGPSRSAPTASAPLATSFRRHPRRARSAPPLGDRRRNHLLFHHHVDRGPLRRDFRRRRSPEGPRRAPRAVGAHGHPRPRAPPPNFPPGPAATPGAIELGADPLAYIVRAQREHGDVVAASLSRASDAFSWATPTSPPTSPSIAPRSPSRRAPRSSLGSSLAGEGLLVSDGDVWRASTTSHQPAFRARRRGHLRLLHGERGRVAPLEVENAIRSRRVRGFQHPHPPRRRRRGLRRGRSRRSRDGDQCCHQGGFRIFRESIEHRFHRARVGPDPDAWGTSAAGPRALGDAARSVIAERRAKRGESSRDTSSDDRSTTPVDVNRRVPRVNWDPERKDWVDAEARTEEGRSTASSSGAASAASPDLLDRLLDARDDGEDGDGAGMDDTSLRDELMTLMVAGQETSAILLRGAARSSRNTRTSPRESRRRRRRRSVRTRSLISRPPPMSRACRTSRRRCWRRCVCSRRRTWSGGVARRTSSWAGTICPRGRRFP